MSTPTATGRECTVCGAGVAAYPEVMVCHCQEVPWRLRLEAEARVAACCLPGGACHDAGLADAQHMVEPLVAVVADALAKHISAEPQVREDIARAAVNAISSA
jgi:hypothetical protein